MKKIVAAVLSVLLVLSLAGCGAAGETGQTAAASGNGKKYEGQTLHFFNFGGYTGENFLQNFEARTGCRVVMDIVETPEEMYLKIVNGDAYDVIVESDYMVERMISEGLVQKLDKSKLPNLSELEPSLFKKMVYDPADEYSVPFFWGMVGITYDKTIVDEADLEREGFGILEDPKYKGNLFLYDSERDMMMVALKHLGYSMNTEDDGELEEAYQWLKKVVTENEPEIIGDEVVDNMVQLRKALAVEYSGDAAYAMVENENAGFYLPEEGTNLWIDNMLIPKASENVDLAHEFINYACEYETSLDNTVTVGYTSPNVKAAAEMVAPGGDFEGINAYSPRLDNPKDEMFRYSEEGRKKMSDLWARVKIDASNAK